ncbi:replication-relaxation family protein [Bacillus sp. REN16]|uniref:replication-relaxation family protein n=1 Tax=Bacillus sp. REN16 TaxID=2887296 RepID=UPI001E3A4B91|nr:replication-relaxation family protein [Bacillus sp. REN16]MCC3359450.1 replication-relaxation family protein [Bacillus sp. REN16]
MSYLLSFNLSYFSIGIIEYLFKYRGMTASQLAAMQNPHGYSLSQEKSIYNYLLKLKKLNLVTATRLRDGYSKGSIYYLTSEGYEYAKNWLNIEEGQGGDGWIFGNGFPSFADIPYETYKPPLEQTTHHLLQIDFFAKVRRLPATLVDHRLNLYSSEYFEIDSEKYRFRPDAEITLLDTLQNYTVEIDRGTESHEQLRNKFRTYRQYFDFISNEGIEKLPNGIIFVVEEKRKNHGMKRRWVNVLSAFFAEIGPYHKNVNLIMTPMDKVEEVILTEMDRKMLEGKASREVSRILEKSYEKVTSYSFRDKKEVVTSMAYSHAIKEDSYIVYFNATSQMYESKVYSRFFEFKERLLNNAQSSKEVENLAFIGWSKQIFYVNEPPYLVGNLSNYNLDKNIQEQLIDFDRNVEFIKLK